MSRVQFQLLELSIISAQDIASVSKNPKTYAVAWLTPDRKFKTSVDQKGHTNPTWNDRFVFRVDETLLNSDASFVVVEIYAVGWIKDTLLGSVTVLISSLIPPGLRHDRRFLALQIRRPSGRPQGILNMAVSLLDNTMHSMPLCTELSGSTVGFRDLSGDGPDKDEKKNRLIRSMSDKTDVMRNQGENQIKNGSVATGAGLGSVIDCGVGVGGGGGGFGGGSVMNGGGSMVDGSVCGYSDLGPSASVVAAAVAMGLYPIQKGPPPRPCGSVLEDWTVVESTEEGLKTRVERWRMEGHDRKYERLGRGKKREKKRRNRRHRRAAAAEEEEDDGKFTCFGTVYGCEFKIVCGGGDKGGGRKNKRHGYKTTSSKSSDSELCS